MGLRLTMFAVGFNALWWLGRSTLGAVAMRHLGEGGALALSALGPAALLGLAAYLSPSRRAAFITVASASLGLGAALGGA